MSNSQTTNSNIKEMLIRIVGGFLDLIFTTYLVFRAIRSDTFDAAMPYLMLFGIWCCSMTLVKIRDCSMQNDKPQTTELAWYDMKLGDRYAPDNNTMIVRVPGGWIWGDMEGTCFIPWSNEFQPRGVADDLPF